MRPERHIDWHPAKNRPAVASIQEHIASHPSDVFNMYYFITPEFIFDHIGDIEGEVRKNGIVVPEALPEVSHDFARIFVSTVYGINLDDVLDIEVGRSASASGWALAVPENCLKDKGVSLLDWDYDSFLSKEAAKAMNTLRAKSARR